MNGTRQLNIGPFQSDVLNLSRWLAALLVVIGHLRSLMFVDYQPGLGALAKALYFVSGFGHLAVMVFFVMSGFLVGGKALDRLSTGTFSWQKYGVDRASRLYAVYLLALMLGGALDVAGYHYFNRFGLYDQSFTGPIAVVNHDFHQQQSVPVFVENLFMCQTVLAPVFGSNGPLWSLANEFWYYLAGPVLFMLLYQRGWRTRAFGVGTLLVLGWFLPSDMIIYFAVWLMGAALYYVNSRRLLSPWFSLPLFAVALVVAREPWLKLPYAGDFLVAATFALVINSSVGGFRRLFWPAAHRQAADFSYSVYLCHFPFLAFALSALYQVTGRGLRGPCDPMTVALAAGVLALAYFWCYLISLGTERQTGRIRDWLKSLFGQTRSKAGTEAAPAKQRVPVP